MKGNMVRLTYSLALATLIALAGCESPRRGEEATVPGAADDLAEAERAAIAGAVEHAWADMMAGARALDPGRIRAGYVDRPIVVINGLIIDDFDRGQFQATRRWIGSLRQFAASYDHVHLEVLSRTAAVATMNHHLKWTDTTGMAGEWHSAWTAVFQRIKGRWRIVHSHESVPPATPK